MHSGEASTEEIGRRGRVVRVISGKRSVRVSKIRVECIVHGRR